MRIMEFKMERPDLVKVGDVVPVSEGVLPSSFYYVIEPAVAMSANIPTTKRLKAREGKIAKIDAGELGYYLTVEFDEE